MPSLKVTQSICICLLEFRLFTVLYFSVRSSRSSVLWYGLPSCVSFKTTKGAVVAYPTPTPSVHSKSRWPPLTVRRAVFRRPHEKIGDCKQSKSSYNWQVFCLRSTTKSAIWLRKKMSFDSLREIVWSIWSIYIPSCRIHMLLATQQTSWWPEMLKTWKRAIMKKLQF